MTDRIPSRSSRTLRVVGVAVIAASLVVIGFGLGTARNAMDSSGADGALDEYAGVSPTASVQVTSTNGPMVRGLLPLPPYPVSDTFLRLDIAGGLLFSEPLAAPPIVEVAPDRITFIDLGKRKDFTRIAELMQVPISRGTFDAIVAEAKAAGLTGEHVLLSDEDDGAIYPVSHKLILWENGTVTGSLILQGKVSDNERGSTATQRLAIWRLIQHLVNPIESYRLSQPLRYFERIAVLATGLPSEIRDAIGGEILTWDVAPPASWANGCQVFAGADAVAVYDALASVKLGRPWLDARGALWSLIARPLSPVEPSPCDM